jgi:hypothetical protein
MPQVTIRRPFGELDLDDHRDTDNRCLDVGRWRIPFNSVLLQTKKSQLKSCLSIGEFYKGALLITNRKRVVKPKNTQPFSRLFAMTVEFVWCLGEG